MAKRILVIDDEKDIRRVVQISLERFGGWKTVLAASGQEGLEKAQSELPDAILLDVTMPDIDGFEVYRQLKANPVTDSIAVVLLTAKALPRDRQKFAEMGVAGVITKPFSSTTIWSQVAEILSWDRSSSFPVGAT